jgi:hypothetical protein
VELQTLLVVVIAVVAALLALRQALRGMEMADSIAPVSKHWLAEQRRSSDDELAA